MTTDGSTGRRDGFNRWVASMKTDQPMETKAAPLKPAVGKLELELDDNATHVHRIPKELISRMREREQPPAPPPPESSDDEDDDEARGLSPLGMVQEDRTAVFRPPPELLARAKRIKAPPKPDAQASVPTKPPPPGAGDHGQSMPAAAKVPAFESVPAAAKGGFASVPVKTPLAASASARAPMTAVARAEAPAPAAQKATAAAAAVDFSEPVAEHAPPASSPAPDSSAVFARREPGSGVLQVAPEPPRVVDGDSDPPTRAYNMAQFDLSESLPAADRAALAAALAEPPNPFAEFEEPPAAADPESPFAFEPSSVVPIVPPSVDVAGPALDEAPPEAEEPPTTHAPVVVAEPSAAVERRSSGALRVMFLLLVAAATVAFAWWRTRHF